MMIRVRLLNASRGDEEAGEFDVPIEKLPAEIEPDATVTIGGSEWSVKDGEPARADEFGRTGRLTLRVYPILRMDPRELLMSLPTISDELPALSEAPARDPSSLFRIREDDWRQMELVSARLEPEVRACLAQIRRIYAEERAGVGFRRLHMRTEVPHPIDERALPFDELFEALERFQDRPYSGLSFHGAQQPVRDGFALKSPTGLHLYGQLEDGHVRVLGLSHLPTQEDDARFLSRIARQSDLRFVDWVRAELLVPGERAFEPAP